MEPCSQADTIRSLEVNAARGEANLAAMNDRLTSLDTKVDRLEGKMDNVVTQVENIRVSIAGLPQLNTKKSLDWRVWVFLPLIGAVIAWGPDFVGALIKVVAGH